ncbi:uncharacterized protein LOC124898496 [Capsicum annuum]|uniref:uncharacterized protein LOC124898496 n=1 Tax=Capsicum annuum TaxID=4072 RepID=UPI001FB0E3A3|nr:uncharacterized protein LOC124898496 [Capsicum annuum]
MTVKATGSYVYCVYESGRRYIVDIDHGTCNYCRYQIDETPCEHAISILKSKNVDVKDWNVSEFVDAEEILPPKYKRPPSRPKKGRHLKSSESLTASSNHCSKFGHAGHNRRTFNYFPKEG